MKYPARYLLLVITVYATVCFLFYRLAYPYHLIHREQMLLFTYTTEQLTNYFIRPASLACLVGDFFTQFLHYPSVGAIIVALLMILTGILVYFVCRKWVDARMALVIAIVIIMWENFRFCDINYPLAGTIALIGALGLFLLADKLNGKWIFIFGTLCGTILSHVLFGYGMIVFVLLALLSVLTRKKNLVGGCLILLLALSLPSLGARVYLTPIEEVYFAPATCWYGIPDFENERILGLNTEDYVENWEKINELVYKGDPANGITVCYNLANAMQGRLPERLMNYNQSAALGLFIPIDEKSTYLSTQLAGEVWFQLGDMTMAEHAAILSMIFSPQGRNVRMVQRLAEINLINGDEEAARKYLRILSKTLFYQQWAKDRMPSQETKEVKEWLKLKRIDIPQRDELRLTCTDVKKSLHLLLKANPDNHMARDYLLCFDLLMKDLPTFVEDYQTFYNDTPNRLYAEALMIYLYQKRAIGNEVKTKKIPPIVVREFNEYNHLHAQAGGNPFVLETRFRRTYWFYYQFVTFQ